MQYLLKIILSALIITGVSELGKRFTPLAAILASLPLVSIIAMIWLYADTKDTQKITDLSVGIFWAVLPSLVFFVILPLLLKSGVKFPLAMALSGLSTFLTYSAYLVILARFGIKI